MTTWSSTTRVRSDSDATFREWGSEFAAAMAAVGLTQTADTGQINWVTVTRPGAINTVAGYEIWRFNDAQHSTSPIFFRVNYGTGSGSTSAVAISITVGTGSNGSGTITGTALTTSRTTNNTSNGQTTDTTRNSNMCYVDGFFGFNWKQLSTTEGSFFIARAVDNTGTATADGAMVYWGAGATGSATTQALRFPSTAVAYTAQNALPQCALCLNPQAVSVSAISGNNQAFLAWTITPTVTPIVGVCGVIDSELTANTTFTEPLIGTTPRTYIAWTTTGGPAGPINAASAGGIKVAMLWE